MLDALKRLFSSSPGQPDWREVSGWARSQQYAFKIVREAAGFAIDGAFGSLPWRLEWGPPQRAYVKTRELRLRMALAVPEDAQALLLNRSLLDALEAQTFEDFTQGTQTYVGSAIPEEMRWLAMWQRSPLPGQRELRQHLAALAPDPAIAARWVDGPLGLQLLGLREGLLKAQPPFLLMANRGRLYLRMELAEATAPALAEAVGVFGVAAQQWLAVCGVAADERDWSATAIAAWQGQLPSQLGEPGPPRG
ncbi:hypothetical protein [Piscinibacter sakaiensis]|uniref:Uncharacterized protein n=1 Tax=Piscinibacter sakaiensis TaxID=1547922 RepID=A0A0K8NW31_PISS1|nr:hypothetical protein [Piscinibacter sakaiensis]GAP34591.1 hypothetical protein ISF6_5060 [Piscinibacter sakaiensis]